MQVDITPQWRSWAEAYARMTPADQEQAFLSLAAEQQAHFHQVWAVLAPELAPPPSGAAVAAPQVTVESPRSERQHQRLERELDVLFTRRGDPVPYRGKADNISIGGLRLTSEASQPVGSRLLIRIEDSENGFVGETEVVHSGGPKMGIRFLQFNELVAPLLTVEGDEEDDEARDIEEAYEAELGKYKVSYASPAEFNAVHESIRQIGGMTVSTAHPSGVGKHIKVEVSLAYVQHEPVRLAARVVRPFQGEEAEKGDMGVEITNLQTAVPDLRRLRELSDRATGQPG